MKRRVFPAIFIGLLLCAGWCAWYGLGLFRSVPDLSATIDLPSSAALPAGGNVRQGPNQCGPYAAAMASVALGEDVTAEKMVQELPWKLPGGYTHPRALEALLRGRSFVARSYDAGSLSDGERAFFLRRELAAGSPVIVLTYMYGYQHYVTLLGYDGDAFFVYDPVFTRGEEGMTVDANGNAPGNRTINEETLLSDWSGGGIAGFYGWYALAVNR